MGLIGGIVGGIAGAVGGALGGSARNKGFAEQQKLFNQRIAEAKAHRDAVYYQDPTQTAENQAAVTEAQELLNQQAQAVKNSNIVSGGTDESVALQKQQAAQTVGKMMRDQAVQGAAKKEQAYQHADTQIDAFTKYLADSKMAQANAKAQAIENGFSGLAQAAEGLDFGGKIGKTNMTW